MFDWKIVLSIYPCDSSVIWKETADLLNHHVMRCSSYLWKSKLWNWDCGLSHSLPLCFSLDANEPIIWDGAILDILLTLLVKQWATSKRLLEWRTIQTIIVNGLSIWQLQNTGGIWISSLGEFGFSRKREALRSTARCPRMSLRAPQVRGTYWWARHTLRGPSQSRRKDRF